MNWVAGSENLYIEKEEKQIKKFVKKSKGCKKNSNYYNYWTKVHS